MIIKNLFLSLIFSIAFISCQKFDHTDPANYQNTLEIDVWRGLGVDDLGNLYMQSPAGFYKFDGEKLKVLFRGNLEIHDFVILDSDNIWVLLNGNLLYHIGKTGIRAFQLIQGESYSMSVSKKNTGEILIGIENQQEYPPRVLIYEISEQLNKVSLKKELNNIGNQIIGVDYEGNFWIRTAESNNEYLVYDGESEKLVEINGLVWIYNNQESSLFLTYETSFKLWKYNGSGFEQVEIYNNNFFSELNSDFRRAEYLDNENFLVFYGDNSFGIYSKEGSYEYFLDPDNLVSPGVYVSNKSGVCWGLYDSENLVRFRNGVWTYYPFESLTL